MGICKYDITFFKNLALKRNGECLSNTYINIVTKLKWKCNKNHEWLATPHNIKNGSWCPICNHISPININDMQIIARKKGGKCLSNKYINIDTKLKWKCAENHQWMATPYTIKNGSWCPICVNKNILLTIEEMQEIAKNKNGKCLSTEYINSHSKLLWECKKGHQWTANPTNIKSGKWCPFCRESQGEMVINNYLISNKILFEREKRFNECKNKKLLPFDFYLPDFNILIEYDGEQHYNPIMFHNCSNEEVLKSFMKIQQNDEIKNNYCQINNIQLIRIPYTIKNIEEYLKNKLEETLVGI